MARGDQWEVWDPFCTADHLTAKQRADIGRAQSWSLYMNGGGGDPRYFDYLTWLKGHEAQWSKEEEHKRERLGAEEERRRQSPHR